MKHDSISVSKQTRFPKRVIRFTDLAFPRNEFIKAELNLFFEASLRDSTFLLRRKNIFLFIFSLIKTLLSNLMDKYLGDFGAITCIILYLASAFLILVMLIVQKPLLKRGLNTTKIVIFFTYSLPIFACIIEMQFYCMNFPKFPLLILQTASIIVITQLFISNTFFQ